MIVRPEDWNIYCDGCHALVSLSDRTGDIPDTKREATKKARQVFPEWRFLPDGTCLCPDCKDTPPQRGDDETG